MWFEVKKGSITLWDEEELFQYHILQVQTWKFLRQARIFFSQSLNQFNHSVIKSWYQIISIIKIFPLWIYGTYSFVIDKTTIQNIPLMTWFPLSFPSLEMPLGSHLRWLVPSNFSSTTTASIPCQLISLPWTVTIYTASTNLRCLHV